MDTCPRAKPWDDRYRQDRTGCDRGGLSPALLH
jgi:hypothetical protein